MRKLNVRKETIETIKFVIILVIIYFILVLSFQYIPFLNQYHTFAIQTNSMEPIIDVGDVVVVKDIDTEDIQIGDIVAFNVDFNNDGYIDVVVHYIDEIQPFGDDVVFKTKPHISDQQDSWTIEETDIIGVYDFQIKSVGRILLFAQSWIGRVMILFDIVVVSVIYDMFKKPKKSDEDNEVITDDMIKEIEEKYKIIDNETQNSDLSETDENKKASK